MINNLYKLPLEKSKRAVTVTSKTGKKFIQMREEKKPSFSVKELQNVELKDKPNPILKLNAISIFQKAGINFNKFKDFKLYESDIFESNKEMGMIEYNGSEVKVLINRDSNNKLLTAVHEMCHLFDMEYLGIAQSELLKEEQNVIASTLLSEIIDTPTYEKLQDRYKENPTIENEELLKFEELFSRTMVAYLAYKTKNQQLIKELKDSDKKYLVDLPSGFVDMMDKIIKNI